MNVVCLYNTTPCPEKRWHCCFAANFAKWTRCIYVTCIGTMCLIMLQLAGDAEMVPEQCSGQNTIDENKMNVSPDAREVQNETTEIPVMIKFRRQRHCRTSGSSNWRGGRHAAVKHGACRRKKRKKVSQHICPECGRHFGHRQLLVTHLVTHSGERPFPCRYPGCEKRFGQSSTRNYHECTHSDVRPYVCSQCGLGFKLAPVLRIHVTRMHGSGELPHHCDQCGRQFKVIGGLRTHVRTVHSEDRPHACNACPKRFKSRQQLVRHTRDIHCAEKPLHCPVCGRAFTQACNMRTHMRTHTGEKPFVCDVCGVRFAHSGSLKGHRSSHHKQTLHVTKTECESVNMAEWMAFNAAVSTV